jgi:hypothetical protein
MWSQLDNGEGLDWEDALAWVEEKNAENYLGYSDWRLPNAKELQSIVDYTRSPDTTGSAAIDPLFSATSIINEAGEDDYPCYWSGTTHANWTESSGTHGAYVAFGRAMGYSDGAWVDVHGAGAQRSDPKTGDPADYPTGNGPQGDAVRIYNHVRLVRDADMVQRSDSAAAGYDDWRVPSLKERFSISDFETDRPYIDSTYQPNNLNNAGTSQYEMDSSSGVNIFTIDTQGNISGITKKMLEILP